ncbi:MAG: thiamine-phosphate kinase [Varibaculum cambriense]|uniref:thiamine-phosphate kinase n=1 Tax=Varibaculum cambriense TaxID=184870 RepID=UPI0028FE274C|nr:thiamine-phosphate kinase [Varibaculum cambriense]MDU1051501.1 thiamine-phosphate kinase [Varibaculum cambriense]
MSISDPAQAPQVKPSSSQPSPFVEDAVPTQITAEDRLIADFTSNLHSHSRVLVGSGDDCAVLTHPDSRSVISTDVLVEGVHFRRDWMSLEQIGRRAAAQNAADIAAMGASAHSAVAAVTTPKNMGKTEINALAAGLATGLESYGYSLVGGDLSSGPCLQVAVTVIGDLEGRPPLLRCNARSGDLIYFAGNLGKSAAGLALLERFQSPQEAIAAPTLPTELRALAIEALSCYQVPQVPADLASKLADAGAHALMDVSDGLSRDGAKIAAASGVVLNLSRSHLEAYAQRLAGLADFLGANSWDWVFGGGEDHGLLCSASAGFAVPGFTAIGEVLPAKADKYADNRTGGRENTDQDLANSLNPYLLVDGSPYDQQGWDHFSG